MSELTKEIIKKESTQTKIDMLVKAEQDKETAKEILQKESVQNKMDKVAAGVTRNIG